MLDILATDFSMKHLPLEGGGGINGSFLTAGLIDESHISRSWALLPVEGGTF